MDEPEQLELPFIEPEQPVLAEVAGLVEFLLSALAAGAQLEKIATGATVH